MGAELSDLGKHKEWKVRDYGPKKWKVRDFGKALPAKSRWVDLSGAPLSDERMESLGAKKLVGGWHSSAVWLLPGDVVEKRYGNHAERVKRMEIEIQLLTRLADCDFVPKILDIDRSNKIIRMTYCGKPAVESVHLRTTVSTLMKTLEEKWGVYRKDNIGKKAYRLGCNRNVTIDDKGKIFIIDFGSDHWFVKEPGRKQIVRLPPHPHGPKFEK